MPLPLIPIVAAAGLFIIKREVDDKIKGSRIDAARKVFCVLIETLLLWCLYVLIIIFAYFVEDVTARAIVLAVLILSILAFQFYSAMRIILICALYAIEYKTVNPNTAIKRIIQRELEKKSLWVRMLLALTGTTEKKVYEELVTKNLPFYFFCCALWIVGFIIYKSTYNWLSQKLLGIEFSSFVEPFIWAYNTIV